MPLLLLRPATASLSFRCKRLSHASRSSTPFELLLRPPAALVIHWGNRGGGFHLMRVAPSEWGMLLAPLVTGARQGSWPLR